MQYPVPLEARGIRLMRLEEKGYTRQAVLGRGTTSQVFGIVEKDSGRIYACKFSNHADWLEAESELMLSLRHSLFPKWKDFWRNQTGACLIMEYIPGSSLQEHLQRRKGFSPMQAIRIIRKLSEGMVYLQEREKPVIYRDLKPENVMIGQKGEVRLLDLGAAALTKGWKAGTVGYSAPELFEAGTPYPASDVYSLGVLLQELWKGELPASLMELARQSTALHPQDRIPDARTFLQRLA